MTLFFDSTNFEFQLPNCAILTDTCTVLLARKEIFVAVKLTGALLLRIADVHAHPPLRKCETLFVLRTHYLKKV